MTYIDPDLFGVSEVAAELYGACVPGQTHSWPEPGDPDDLLTFCEAIASMLDDWWGVTQENWETVLDADAAPDEALGWLAMFVGVRRDVTWTADQLRDAIRSPAGFARGTPAAIREAAKRHLTGSKTVIMTERFGGSAYSLYIRTLASETPDEAVTLADILTQKPAGIVLNYDTLTGQDYAGLDASYSSYAGVDTDYESYGAVATDLP
jgi:hypothetical protein